jgi:hypothetical protein
VEAAPVWPGAGRALMGSEVAVARHA